VEVRVATTRGAARFLPFPGAMKTMMTAATATAIACLLSLSAGCKREPTQTSTTHTTSADQREGTMGVNKDQSTLSSSDKDFMTKALQGSRLEVALGREATAQAASPDVKAFGERMITDHGRAADELKQLAAQKKVDIPTALDDSKESKVEKMAKLNGSAFDKEYVTNVVDDHEDDISDFRKAAGDLMDPDLKAWANKQLPILESHLTMAKGIKAKVKH
jgi:putative membrane protein